MFFLGPTVSIYALVIDRSTCRKRFYLLQNTFLREKEAYGAKIPTIGGLYGQKFLHKIAVHTLQANTKMHTCVYVIIATEPVLEKLKFWSRVCITLLIIY